MTQSDHFSEINSRNFSAIFNNLKVEPGNIGGYAIIGAVGLDPITWLSGIQTLDRAAVMKLRQLAGLKMYGKTGITTCKTTADRAAQVVGAISRGKPRVSSYVDVIYSHLVQNPTHQALHLIFGIDVRPGKRESDEVIIEAEIAEHIMQPLQIEVLNLPGRTRDKTYRRQYVDLNLKLQVPSRIIS